LRLYLDDFKVSFAGHAVEALAAQHGLHTPQVQAPGCLLIIAVLLAIAVVGLIVVIVMR
jgi:hypothetical protein